MKNEARSKHTYIFPDLAAEKPMCVAGRQDPHALFSIAR